MLSTYAPSADLNVLVQKPLPAHSGARFLAIAIKGILTATAALLDPVVTPQVQYIQIALADATRSTIDGRECILKKAAAKAGLFDSASIQLAVLSAQILSSYLSRSA